MKLVGWDLYNKRIGGMAMSVLAERRVSGEAKDGMTIVPTKNLVQIGEKLSDLGIIVIRYGLVLVIFWIGAMKFTAYEANGIQPLVANSPLMSWLYGFLSVQAFSNLLGVVEIAIAVMIGLRWLSPKVSAIGSVLATLMFLTTMSFLFSTPGWEPSLGGFPALAVVPGQFLLKDIVLFGASVWSLGESLAAIGASRT
jgi:reactive chlorine resistance protein C